MIMESCTLCEASHNVGKTVTTLNLAYCLQKMGKRVLAVDFDSQANLTTCFGVENTGELENTIGHLMLAEMEDAKRPAVKRYIRTKDGVDFIPSSIYLSVVDAKLRMEMGAEKMFAGHNRQNTGMLLAKSVG